MKRVLESAANSGLKCPWERTLKCHNLLPGAQAPVVHMSCAYATEAVSTTLQKLLLPESFEFLAVYSEEPELETTDQGDVVWSFEDKQDEEGNTL